MRYYRYNHVYVIGRDQMTTLDTLVTICIRSVNGWQIGKKDTNETKRNNAEKPRK